MKQLYERPYIADLKLESIGNLTRFQDTVFLAKLLARKFSLVIVVCLIRENVSIAGHEDAMAKLEVEGKTAMLIASDQKLIGIIAVADTLKPELKKPIASLKKRWH